MLRDVRVRPAADRNVRDPFSAGTTVMIRRGEVGLPEFYDATGALTAAKTSSVGNPYLFTGRRWDAELGYYYYRNRYMDPVIGRFVSRDPIGLWGDAANLGNGYTYAASNPWSLVDPMGLDGGNQSWWSRLWQWFVTDSLDYSDEATKRRLAKFREDEGPPISPVLPEDYFLDLENPEKVSNSHIYYGALASSEQKNGELAEDVAKRTAEEAAFAAVGGGLGKLGDGLNDARKVGKSARIPGRVVSRINLRVGSADVKGSGLAYAMFKHGGAGPDSKSQFSIPVNAVVELLQSRVVVDAQVQISESSGNFFRVVDVGKEVGNYATKHGGNPTPFVTVITDEFGNLVNTFPGKLAW